MGLKILRKPGQSYNLWNLLNYIDGALGQRELSGLDTDKTYVLSLFTSPNFSTTSTSWFASPRKADGSSKGNLFYMNDLVAGGMVYKSFSGAASIRINPTTYTGDIYIMVTEGTTAPSKYEPYIPYSFKAGVSKLRVPNEYDELEYIGSSGTQYINTGLKNTSEKIVYDFTCANDNDISASSALFGSELSSDGKKYSGLLYNAGSGNKRTLYAGTSVNLDLNYTLTIDKVHNVLTLDNGVATLVRDNIQLGQANYVGSLQNDAYIYLFCNYGSSAKQKSSYRLYEWKMYDNEVLVGHFIPARKKSNNEYGMYDIVNQQFHGNSGTGSFTSGPVIRCKMLNKEVTL